VRWALPALVLLAASDQALYGLGGIVAWQDFIRQDEVVPLLKPAAARPPVEAGRIHRGGFQNLYTLGGYRLLDGYVAIAPRKRLHYDSLQALRAAQVAYVFRNDYPSPDKPATLLGGEWYQVSDVPPRARLVARAELTQQPEADIERVDLQTTALVEHPVALDDGPAGVAAIARDEPGDLDIHTESQGRQLLVLSESHDDGWTAAVDREPAAVERVNGDFIGVVVPAGAHTVALRFVPAHLAWGKRISLAGLLVVVALLALGARWRV